MQKRIVEYLNSYPAEQLLWLAAERETPPLENTNTTSLSLKDWQSDPNCLDEKQFDCAVLQDLPGPVSKAEAESLIAQLRDVKAQRILWVLGGESPWERRELLALGFHHLDQTEDGLALYGFDIDNYKQTPDWLSPKNWANPEQWDKKRW